jgi:hypothetical protein
LIHVRGAKYRRLLKVTITEYENNVRQRAIRRLYDFSDEQSNRERTKVNEAELDAVAKMDMPMIPGMDNLFK